MSFFLTAQGWIAIVRKVYGSNLLIDIVIHEGTTPICLYDQCNNSKSLHMYLGSMSLELFRAMSTSMASSNGKRLVCSTQSAY